MLVQHLCGGGASPPPRTDELFGFRLGSFRADFVDRGLMQDFLTSALVGSDDYDCEFHESRPCVPDQKHRRSFVPEAETDSRHFPMELFGRGQR